MQKMLKKLSEKLGAEFPAMACGYSTIKIVRLNNIFLKVFFICKQAHKKVNHCSEKKRKGEKGKVKKNSKIEKPKDADLDFCPCPS